MENTKGNAKKIYWAAAAVLLVIIVVVLRLVIGSSDAASRRQGMVIVRTQKPYRELVQAELSYTGDVLPVQQATVYAKVSGTLEHNEVDMGMLVASGRMLALIDTTELYQQYEQTSATYENSLMLYDRAKQLFEKNLASKQDVDNAEATMKVAKANFDAAATHLSYAHVTAPFTGFVTKRYLDNGALVTSNSTALFTMMFLDSVKVIVYVPEKELQQMYRVRTARVTFDALPGEEFTGHVSRFSEAVDLTTRTMPVEVDIPNRSRVIKPGMFADVSFTVGEHPNAMTLETDVLLKDDTSSYVFVLQEARARRIRVRIGAEHDSHTEITEGLAGTVDVIVTGQQFVKDGATVTLQR
jgi:RND family efflux transporter MFP subunit